MSCIRGAELAGPENGRPKKNKNWKKQGWKMTDPQLANNNDCLNQSNE